MASHHSNVDESVDKNFLKRSPSSESFSGETTKHDEEEKEQQPRNANNIPQGESNDPTDPQSELLQHQPSTYMVDTTASKNKYRDKVPLAPGQLPVERSETQRHHERGLERKDSNITKRRPASGDTGLEATLGSQDAIKTEPAQGSETSSTAEPLGGSSAPLSTTAHSDIGATNDSHQKLIERIRVLEKQLEEEKTENIELQVKLKEYNQEGGTFLSQEQMFALSKSTMEIDEKNKKLEESNSRNLKEIETWKDRYRQADTLAKERQAELERQERLKSQIIASPTQQQKQEEVESLSALVQSMIPANKDLVARHEELRADYTDACEKIDKLRDQNKALVKGLPQLRREKQTFESDLNSCKVHIKELEESLAQVTAKATDWEAGYKEAVDQLEKQRVEHEEQLDENKKEALDYIKEYHERMPEKDEEWWRMEGLRKKIKRLEKERDKTLERLETVTRNREDAYTRIKLLLEEVEALKSVSEADTRDQRVKSNDAARTLPLASWDTPEAYAARKEVMREFREKQQKRRERIDKEEEVKIPVRDYK